MVGESADRFRILTIDGGGIRGLIAARVVARLEELISAEAAEERRVADCFQMVAGTSTGGLIALGLTVPDPANPGSPCPQTAQHAMRQGRLVADLPTAELRMLLRSTQYQIRVKGQLGSQWSEWFDGLTVLPAGGDETSLRGTIVDQAALHGLIGKVRDLALPLLAVTREELSLDDILTRFTESAAQRRGGRHSRGRATRDGATTMIRDVHLTRSNDQWPISRPAEEKRA